MVSPSFRLREAKTVKTGLTCMHHYYFSKPGLISRPGGTKPHNHCTTLPEVRTVAEIVKSKNQNLNAFSFNPN